MSSHLQNDTICALASGPPPSGIAVVRVSGPRVADFAKAHVCGNCPPAHTARLRQLQDADGTLIDEALVLFMPAGASYTGEDVLEIHLHGGAAVVEHMLEALTQFSGIRLAGPGEFTRRAFEAGRLDLTQAEGIADLIEAETRAQKQQALAQTDGALSATYKAWRESLLGALALLEVSVDFPDEAEAPQMVNSPVLQKLLPLMEAFELALKDGATDQGIRDGFRIAIIGAPNVGKSTLLNRFAKRDAAIVTDIPGTTRDVVEVRCKMAGHIVWFADTAGLRETEDPVEAEGVRRARALASEADLRIFLTSEGHEFPTETTPLPGDLSVRSKADLGVNEPLTPEVIPISAKTGDGFDQLEGAIEAWLLSKTNQREAPVITRARHRNGVETALAHVRSAVDVVEQDMGAELASEDVRLAARALASLVGEIGVEEVLGAVFSEFCIGK